MEIQDVHPPAISPPENVGPHIHLQFFDRQLLHQFPFNLLVSGGGLCDNQVLRIPRSLNHWPPAVIFHFIYGVAVLKRWYEKGSLKEWEDSVRAEYEEYNDSDDSRCEPEAKEDGGGETDRETVRHGSLDAVTMAMHLVYTFWQRNTVPDMDRIGEWLKETASGGFSDGEG
jgi:hypothetical protein